ncbi:MAG: adenylyl-sulfate kinase [Phenylobacterium zucineum]|nr:MAG: adenylyl-sulfate kinase [Phenylobacterium zucineum]
MRVLIMGLPASGKTTLARDVALRLGAAGVSVAWFNADMVRSIANDWDFSEEGRLRQANRMRELADNSMCQVSLCDFVAPTEEIRGIFDADLTIWMDTIKAGRFDDTNKVFTPPHHSDIRFMSFADVDPSIVVEFINEAVASMWCGANI